MCSKNVTLTFPLHYRIVNIENVIYLCFKMFLFLGYMNVKREFLFYNFTNIMAILLLNVFWMFWNRSS